MSNVLLDAGGNCEKGLLTASPFTFLSSAGDPPGGTGLVGVNSNRGLVGFILARDANNMASRALSWAGVAMPSLGSVTVSAGIYVVHLFGLAGDGNIATGAQNVSATWTGGTSENVCAGILSLYNVDPIVSFTNFGSNTGGASPSTITLAGTIPTNMLVGATSIDNGAAPTINTGTLDWIETDLNGNYAAGHNLVVGGSTTLAFNTGAVAWAAAAIEVIAFGAGGTTLTGFGRRLQGFIYS